MTASTLLRSARRGLRTMFAAALALPLLAVAAPAQDVMRIAAVVNDEIISIYDVIARTRFALLTTGLPDSPENMQRMVPQVLRALVDEQLQLQEAKRQNISIDPAEVDERIAEMAEQNNLPPAQLERLLDEAGSDIDTVRRLFRTVLAWRRVVERSAIVDLSITDEQVDNVIAEMQANQGKPRYLVSEIVLTIDNPTDESQVRQATERIVAEIREGANFSAVANQFSQSASAAVGGDIGWVQEQQVDPALAEALRQLQPGQISQPVRTLTGFHVLLLRDRQAAATPGEDEVRVSLEHIFFRVPANANEDDVAAATGLARQIGAAVGSCEEMRTLREESGAATIQLPAEVRMGDLQGRIRQAVGGLKVGEVSEPFQAGPGILVVMLCDRVESDGGIDRRQVERTLINQRLDIVARRLMRDLRRTALVDVRI